MENFREVKLLGRGNFGSAILVEVSASWRWLAPNQRHALANTARVILIQKIADNKLYCVKKICEHASL